MFSLLDLSSCSDDHAMSETVSLDHVMSEKVSLDHTNSETVSLDPLSCTSSPERCVTVI